MKIARVEYREREFIGTVAGQTVTLYESRQLLSGQALTNVLWAVLEDELEEEQMRQTARETDIDHVRFLAPFPAAPSFRDFYAFEEHVANARKRRGVEGVHEHWYKAPAFYFSNPGPFFGPEDEIPIPKIGNELDYELEVGIVLRDDARNIPVELATEYVAGFMVLNDWSMRDVQREEVKVGLGPHKGKDFATSIGPYLVTLDELEDWRVDGPDGPRWSLQMTARVNGVETSRGNFDSIHFTVSQLIAHASRDASVRRGDILGSGTVGTGCLLEQGAEYLKPGDVVELEIERLGVLRNVIGLQRG